MKNSRLIKELGFYCWLGLAYMSFVVWHEVVAFDEGLLPVILNNCWRGVYIVMVNVVFFEYAAPFITRKRRWIVYNIIIGAALFMVFMFLWSFGLYFWRSIAVGLHIYTPLGEKGVPKQLLASQMGISVGSFVFFGICRHVYNYVKLQRAEQQLRIEKQAAELNFLRAQTNPHFLFNTLNNIYSLARDKSELAPESILRLSKILRFMLYETGGEYISLEQELKIIADYIELEKLRYDDSLQIRFTNDIEDMKQAIPPLLLIPLVENAFKHGVSETRDKPFINIHLSVKRRQLELIVKNSADATSVDTGTKDHIGLSNLRRQLELLYTSYNLVTQQDNSVFTATLQINLASHV